MGWSSLDVREDLRKLEEQLKKETNSLKRDEIINSIANCKLFIAYMELKKYDDLHPKEEDDSVYLGNETDIDTFTGNMFKLEEKRLYIPKLKEYVDICDNNAELDYVYLHNGSEDLSKDDIIGLTHDFYKSTNPYFFKKYLEFYKNRDKMLTFNPDVSSTKGNCFHFETGSCYIEVGTKGDCEHILTSLTHEIGHLIGSRVNPKRYFDKDVFIEIESLFFELIGYDYYHKALNRDIFKEMDIAMTYDMYEEARKVLAYKRVFDDTFERLPKLDDPYTYYSLRALREEDYEDNLDLDEKFLYVTSFIVALDLYEIYKIDKDRALHLLREIIKPNSKISEYERITNNIKFNEHTKDHVKSLKRW